MADVTQWPLTAAQLRAIVPAAQQPTARLNQLLPHLNAAMVGGDITTRQRVCMFLGQVLHESGGLRHFVELWGPTPAQRGYEGRRDLGNVNPGDGYRYRGRGAIQLTGRANYRAAGRALGVPLEASPDKASLDAYAFEIAVWFWTTRGLNPLADRGDYVGITRRINGGTHGLSDRMWWLARCEAALPRDWPAPQGEPTPRAALRAVYLAVEAAGMADEDRTAILAALNRFRQMPAVDQMLAETDEAADGD